MEITISEQKSRKFTMQNGQRLQSWQLATFGKWVHDWKMRSVPQ